MRTNILGMVKYTLNEYRIAAHSIEDTVASMNLASNVLAIVGAGLARKRYTGKQCEGFIEATHIIVRNIVSEPLGTVIIDLSQVPAR